MKAADKPCVIGLGELLWDCFPDTRQAGGAPANFAFHAGQLGAEGVVVSRVGKDELGDGLIDYLHEHGLNTDFVQRDADHPTGRVDVTFSSSGEPNYEFLADSAWDFLKFDQSLKELAARASAVCFGTLAQRSETSRAAIHAFVDATSGDCLRVFDVNLRPPWYSDEVIRTSLEKATLVKLNEDEVHKLSRMFAIQDATTAAVAGHLLQNFPARFVVATRGANGCQLYSPEESVEVSGVKVENPQPVGAGDSFTAATIWGLLQGWNLSTVANFANHVAAVVASHQGAMPDVQAELKELLPQ